MVVVGAGASSLIPNLIGEDDASIVAIDIAAAALAQLGERHPRRPAVA